VLVAVAVTLAAAPASIKNPKIWAAVAADQELVSEQHLLL
jgi:hypothetical protein